MADAILVLNAGSSSLKFSVYAVSGGGEPALVFKGQVEAIGAKPMFSARSADGAIAIKKEPAPDARDQATALAHVAAWLRERSAGHRLVAVGHRVVHGGPHYAAPTLIDDQALERLDALCPLAPLHQPHNLAAIRAVRARFADMPQVACFDTAFHHGHPAVADRFALPEPLYQEGVRRYGFHGVSYEYIARTLPQVAPQVAKGRVVVAHLGSGASMCALRDGKSVDSTLSFTALDGLPMGTRCGAIDPGVLLYLLMEKKMEPKAIERLLYQDSGLKGISGVSNDMRDLLPSEAPGARLAVEYFVYRAAREIGALAAALQGLDALVFTAGIGENAPEIRARICRRAAWMGVTLDEAANGAGGPRITRADSPVSAWVIPTDEERMIAIHTLAALRQPAVAG